LFLQGGRLLEFAPDLGHAVVERLQLGSERFGDEEVRFIEFDADVHALDIMLVEELKANNVKSLTARQAGDIAFLVAFAAIVVGQILDQGEPDVALQSRRTHPPPVWRAIFLSALLIETIPRETSAGTEEIGDRLNEAWTEAEHVASVLGLTSGRWGGMSREEMQRTWHLDDFETMRTRYLSYATKVIDRLVTTDGRETAHPLRRAATSIVGIVRQIFATAG